MQRIIRVALGCGVVAALVLLVSPAASAHERREVAGGQYELVVGFLDEPAFVGEKNGLDLRVTKPAPAGSTPTAEGEEPRTPVEGLTETLTAEVIYGDETMELALEPRFRDPGAYAACFFPMAEGDYTFHIFGEIEGTAIDETFTSSPEGFASVEPREPLEFPKGEAAIDGAAAAATLGDGSDGFATGPRAGLLAGALGLVGGGTLLARRAAARRVAAPAAARS